MNRRVLCVSFLLALASACGGRSTELVEEEGSGETLALARISLRSSLPSCGASTAGTVYYVVRDEQLVYCDGESHQNVELDFSSSWLVSAGTAASCAQGGSLLRTGPDTNGNGKLDPQEVVASASACHAASGAQGTGGSRGGLGSGSGGDGGDHGWAGSGGDRGWAGTGGVAGTTSTGGTTSNVPQGTGEGLPCDSAADCAGFQANFCDTFVSGTCLISGCNVSPDSCSTGKECCDLSTFGLPTLCIAAGACAN